MNSESRLSSIFKRPPVANFLAANAIGTVSKVRPLQDNDSKIAWTRLEVNPYKNGCDDWNTYVKWLAAGIEASGTRGL